MRPVRKIIYIISCLIFLHLLSTNAIAEVKHKVKRGETLYRIAKNNGVSVENLKKVNGLQGNTIHPGDVITIPTKSTEKRLVRAKSSKNGPSRLSKKSAVLALSEAKTVKTIDKNEVTGNYTTYIVERGDNLYRISSRFGISVKELKRMNNLSRNRIKAGQELLVPKIEEEMPDVIEESSVVTGVAEVEEGEEPQGEVEGKIEEVIARDLTQNGEAQVTEPEKKPEENNGWLSVIDVAMEYIGIPYRFGGTSLRGIDCSAFVQTVYRYFSIDLPRTAREQFKAGVKVSRKELRIGDLIFFRTYARYPSHVGIYIGEGKMIHASSRNKKVTISSINEPYYVRRYIGAVRVPENSSLISAEAIKTLTN